MRKKEMLQWNESRLAESLKGGGQDNACYGWTAVAHYTRLHCHGFTSCTRGSSARGSLSAGKKSHVITWIPPTQRGRFSLWSSLKGSKPTYERFRANQRGLSCTWISFDNILMASAPTTLTELWILLSLQSNSSLTKESFQQFSK